MATDLGSWIYHVGRPMYMMCVTFLPLEGLLTAKMALVASADVIH